VRPSVGDCARIEEAADWISGSAGVYSVPIPLAPERFDLREWKWLRRRQSAVGVGTWWIKNAVS